MEKETNDNTIEEKYPRKKEGLH